jgi:hypothetical protein
MKKLFALAVLSAAFVPVLAAQKATGFTGKWEGTFTMQRQDGSENTQNVVFNLTQKGKALTGTAGPADKQWKIDKGALLETAEGLERLDAVAADVHEAHRRSVGLRDVS